LKKLKVIPLAGPEDTNSSFGNQLFQLAFGLYLKSILDDQILFYIRNGISKNNKESVIDSKIQLISTLLYPNELISTSTFAEQAFRLASVIPGFTFDESSFQIGTSSRAKPPFRRFLARGYFQNYLFADAVEADLINRFKLSKEFDSAFVSQEEQIAVHLRLGDYLTNSQNLKIYGTMKIDYYVNAVRSLMVTTGATNVVIISDQPELAFKMLEKNLRAIPEISVRRSEGSVIEDFCTIASSKASVIGNSTFAWWASWLGHKIQPTKVVFPDPWYASEAMCASGLAYPTWIAMNREG
jgi:hypothetical protein